MRRIVSRRACSSPEALRHMAQQRIEFVHLEETAAHLAALDALCRPLLDLAHVQREREKRKQVRADAKRLKRQRKEGEEQEAAGDAEAGDS